MCTRKTHFVEDLGMRGQNLLLDLIFFPLAKHQVLIKTAGNSAEDVAANNEVMLCIKIWRAAENRTKGNNEKE